MSDQSTQIPVWDGNPEKLPPEGQFIYNGGEYLRAPCPCGCGRSNVYTKDGGVKRDFAMTIRLRGKNQGYPVTTVLVKLGKMEELIKTNGDPFETMRLLADSLMELERSSGGLNDKYIQALEARGISLIEVSIATGEAIGIPPELTIAQMLAALF